MAELVVEYGSGAPTTATIRVGTDVKAYLDADGDPTRLRPFTMQLDPTRVPKYLWVKRPESLRDAESGIAVLSVTQWVDQGAPGSALSPIRP